MNRAAALLGVLIIVIIAVTGFGVVPSAHAQSAADTALLRTPWGDPDFQGVWASDSATPMQRPASVGDREVLMDEEVVLMRQKAVELFNGETDAAFGDSVYETVVDAVLEDQRVEDFTAADTTGTYNHFWLIDRWFENRTSLIVDPPNGRRPPLTPEAQARRDAGRSNSGGVAEGEDFGPAGPEDFGLGLRCSGSRIPMAGRGYNSNYQIIQAPGYVVINMEMMHDSRVIPLDDRPHVPSEIRGFMGDSRGHWEGDTLVVDTTNFRSPDRELAPSTGENLRLTERFSLANAETLRYEFTVDDPTTWTQPWTAVIFMRPAPGTGLVYEFACHEGNYAIGNSLSGTRAQERAAAAASRAK